MFIFHSKLQMTFPNLDLMREIMCFFLLLLLYLSFLTFFFHSLRGWISFYSLFDRVNWKQIYGTTNMCLFRTDEIRVHDILESKNFHSFFKLFGLVCRNDGDNMIECGVMCLYFTNYQKISNYAYKVFKAMIVLFFSFSFVHSFAEHQLSMVFCRVCLETLKVLLWIIWTYMSAHTHGDNEQTRTQNCTILCETTVWGIVTFTHLI